MRLIDVGDGAKLTLNSGKLHLKFNADADLDNTTIWSTGTVEINGGTVAISCPNTWDERGSNLYNQDYALSSSGKAVINGGTLDGRVLLAVVAKASGVADNVITGGDFKKSIYIHKDKDVTGDVPLNVSIQGGTYYYTPGYFTRPANAPYFPGKKESDPSELFQFATGDFTEKDVPHDGAVYPAFPGESSGFNGSNYDVKAFASMFPKNAIITAAGQKYDYYDVREDEPMHIVVNDAAFTGSSSALDLAHLVNSHYKTITVTTLPEDALKDMKLTVGSDGTPLPAKGTSTVSGDVTLGSDGNLTKDVYITARGNQQLKEMYYSKPSKIDFGYRLNIFKDGERVDYTGVISQTYAAVGDEISVSVQLPNFKFEEGVYTFRLGLYAYLRGSEAQIGEYLVGLWKLTAEKEPPAPVAHSIKIGNTHGTATPSTAMAGETVTVKAKDRTADNMMFTQWYTETAGVTFADATKQETTFVMPDCDVEVNPGYHGVSFTNQPTGSWLSSVDDSKVYFAFSQPITSWKLVNEDNTTLASGNAESANALVAATLGPKPDKTEMTCRVIVTANGQNFTSNEFTLKWYNVPGAPDVTVYPEGGKFVETLDVNLETPNTYWEILYTTDGSDPYDKSGTTWTKNPAATVSNDSTQVKISKDTTIKACLYNSEGYSNMEKFGDIATCDFTKVELTPPVADPPSGTSFYDSLNVSLSTDIVNAKIMLSYNDGDVDDLSDPNQWKEYEPEKESITLSGSYGMHGFDALTGIRMEHPDGYTYWVHSDKQEYLYPRISYATIADASVVGKVNEEINPVNVSITLSGDVFAEDLTAGVDVSSWFTNLPAGLTAKVKDRTNYTKTLVITISGTPTATSAAAISVEMPKSALRYTGTGTAIEQTVLPNSKAVYSIVEGGTHTHNYSAWAKLDDNCHYQTCSVAGCDEPTKFEDHTLVGNWKLDTADNTKHYKECDVCKGKVEAPHVESSKITVIPAGIGKEGTWKTECVDCGKPMNTGTFPALTAISAVNVTVTAPVKGETPKDATTADATYSVANTAWDPTVSGTFAGGTKYTVTVSLEAIGNNRFTNATTFQINGKTAAVVGTKPTAAGADSTKITLEFPATSSGSTGGGGGGGVTTYPITVKSAKNGDVTASHKSASKGTAVTLTVDPDKGYVLDTLTVLDGKDKEIKLTEKNGKYTFTMPASKVTVAATFKASAPTGKNPFIDVPAGSYYEDAVVWAVEKGITSGTSAVTFDPNGNCTRAQAVTFLWRAAGSPAPKTKVMPFTDVPSGSYYYDAVLWAMEQGITKGTSDTAFSPNASCTRAQIVTFLWRANGSPAVSGNSAFTDVAADAYYAAAVTWAEKNGVTGGIGGGLFGSNNNCTRAQIVTFLYRSVK
ncbi:S-layer homology domain-containing protein [Oscillibacter sp. MSJ-2]|uniref:S-layer homology domain-containing protein n=1 Tax=Dysosmobacter acutus TaxID=2841504 RepID=A0ABS6FF30_9FIRM|nr:S-layer homology domain-containing protein [Dysosmobacter acutus]MBU5628162.1 S-layer homology domain-containing protein [Dysosmobacter acutus]